MKQAEILTNNAYRTLSAKQINSWNRKFLQSSHVVCQMNVLLHLSQAVYSFTSHYPPDTLTYKIKKKTQNFPYMEETINKKCGIMKPST